MAAADLPLRAGVVTHAQQARPKQQPSFEVCKKNALSKLDKSPKGSLDQPIAELVHAINVHADYVTTSSCSGRISLFATLRDHRRGFKGGRWLLVKHATVTADELRDALAANTEPVELVLFKHEPAIVHVQCRDLAAAKRLLQVALGAGFRESGLVLSGSEKVMLAIRTTANCLELPLATDGALLLPQQYLQLLVAQANERFEANRARTDELHAAFLAACSPSAACAECAGEQSGPGSARPPKRAPPPMPRRPPKRASAAKAEAAVEPQHSRLLLVGCCAVLGVVACAVRAVGVVRRTVG